MITKMTNLWELIEARIACTAYYDWQQKAGDFLSIINPYLLPTNKLEVSYPCPDFEAQGCPREIISYKDKILAVCCNYDNPSNCEMLELTKKDIIHYKVDWYKLTRTLASLFKLKHNYSKLENFMYTYLVGELVSDYKTFPVYIIISCPTETFEQIKLKLTRRHGNNPFILIVFTYKYISQDIIAELETKNNLILCLDDLLMLNQNNKIELQFNPQEIFKDFKNKHSYKNNLYCFEVPFNAEWKDITIKFNNSHAVDINCKDIIKEGVSYTHMNMANKDNDPNEQWKVLERFGENKGVIHARTSLSEKSIKKQKSLLSQKLREYFKLKDDPIYWNNKLRCYRTLFKVYISK